MIRSLQITWLLLAINFIFINFSYATSIQGMNVEQALSASEFVFEGQVIKTEPGQDKVTGLIKTLVTFKITDTIKGKVTSPVISLSFLGGRFGNEVLEVEDMHIPELGEKGIYFVESLNRNQVNPLTGWSQGHFLVLTDQNGVDRISTVDRKPVVTVSIPNQQSAGLSKGYAQGLELASPSLMKNALSKKDFKNYLSNLSVK